MWLEYEREALQWAVTGTFLFSLGSRRAFLQCCQLPTIIRPCGLTKTRAKVSRVLPFALASNISNRLRCQLITGAVYFVVKFILHICSS